MLKVKIVKLLSLIKALLNHKNDKKDQYHIFWDYTTNKLKHTFTFFNTFNTHYSFYLNIVVKVLSNLNFFIKFIQFIRFFKEKQFLNHLESNVLKELKNLSTLIKLACLTLYYKAIFHSFIIVICNTFTQNLNALKLDPLY